MTNAPDDLGETLQHLGRGLKIIADRGDGYRTALEVYDGTRAEVHTSKILEQKLKASAEAFPLSLAHIPVDALIDRIGLSALTSEDVPAAEELAKAYESIEDDADDWFRWAGIFGDYYLIIDADEEDEAGTLDIGEVTITGSSPLTTVVVYDAKTGRVPLYAVKRWHEPRGEAGPDGNGTWRAQVFYDDATIFLVAEGRGNETPKAGTWLLDDADDDEGRQTHVGGRMLVKHLAVDSRPYGTPLHRKAYAAQDAITKLNATNMETTDAQAFPARYALLDPKREVDADNDDDWDDGGQVPGGDPSKRRSKVKVEPGTVAALEGIASAGSWEAIDGSTFYGGLDWYVRAMGVITGTPLFEFDTSGTQPSGESRRRAEVRINKHAQRVIRRFSATLADLGETLLGLAGIEGVTVSATFRPTESAADTEGIALVRDKIIVGVPVRRALLEAGYAADEVDEWWPEEQVAVPLAVLEKLAPALQQLGSSKVTGVITQAQLAEILPDILAASEEGGDDRAVDLVVVEDELDAAPFIPAEQV